MLKRITRRLEHQAAMFGRGADKWLDKPLATFFPYAAFALIGSFHMARLVVRAAEMYGEQNGEQTGIEIGRKQGTKLGRLLQYLESAAFNGWSLADDVFAAILEAQRDEYWPAWVDAKYPGLLDEPFDCSYFVKRHNPNMSGRVGAPVVDEEPDDGPIDPRILRTAAVGLGATVAYNEYRKQREHEQAGVFDVAAARARGALGLGEDPYAEYRGTVLRPVPDEVDADEVDEVQDAELVDEGQAEETAEV